MKNILITFSLLILLFSCNKKQPKKVEFNAKIKNTPVLKDSTLVEFADLPFRIDSTEYLIHIKGYYKKRIKKNKYRSSSDWNRYSENYSVAYNNSNGISGNITNVKFQHIDSTKLNQLTTKKIRINFMKFIKNKNSTSQFIVYKVIDMDTNKDNKLNQEDVESLYISHLNGRDFKKLTTKYYKLLDYTFLKINNTLYFRSIEDINKNGKFEKNDKIHYQFVNLNDKGLNVISYNPL